MHSPAEQILEKAHQELVGLVPRSSDETLRTERMEIVGNITDVIEVLTSRSAVELPDYATADDEVIDVSVASDTDSSTHRRIYNRLTINGTLRKGDEDRPARFPMYRVTRIRPFTDGGELSPHYEIAVADLESKSGYRPLALVEQSSTSRGIKGSSRIIYDMFGSHESLTPADMTALEKTGIYKDPHAAAMIEEVHGILDLAMAQKKAESVATTGKLALVPNIEATPEIPTVPEADLISRDDFFDPEIFGDNNYGKARMWTTIVKAAQEGRLPLQIGQTEAGEVGITYTSAVHALERMRDEKYDGYTPSTQAQDRLERLVQRWFLSESKSS